MGEFPRGIAVDPERTELLVRLLSRHQDDLFRYILAQVPHEDDARDVLQETSVAVCRKFAEYDPARPFLAWAYGFAHLEVLKHRDRGKHRLRPFSREVLERLAAERIEMEPALEVRRHALEVCLDKLSEPDRELIRLRYQDRLPADEAARESGASRRTFFRNLERIRRVLLECIRRQVGPADGT
jgi:RNA polymerase sigma-70 factor (ECF subfamily)